jgi:dolichol-phosphate mannosyltransferase
VFDTYELLAYLPIRAARLGYVCTEVPVTRAYPPAGEIPTKIHGRRAQLELVRILARAASGRYDPGAA